MTETLQHAAHYGAAMTGSPLYDDPTLDPRVEQLNRLRDQADEHDNARRAALDVAGQLMAELAADYTLGPGDFVKLTEGRVQKSNARRIIDKYTSP